ncbi:D123-domain-containing protein [Pleurotus eryngii]|uniref:D123-domain-containing protein n=1 Tax=Pleurotus eryngii TaxID=5323 RepID=A0A9P6A287_PLEER|nr:D123-domain-containing protein [Pleurotus eryngii]
MVPLFPDLSEDAILSFQFSSWYPEFVPLTIKSTVIRPLSKDFEEYLNADGVFVPEGSDDIPVRSTLSDDEGGSEEDEEEAGSEHELNDETPPRRYAFPELDDKIRMCIKEYGAVFPKLNFSAPRDASWVLPASSPLKCTTPSDVYLLLKSSDFITHDLSKAAVFDGCLDGGGDDYSLELVLRKWYPVDRSREVRCFVRDNVLIGISQRDTNYYEFYNDTQTQQKILAAVRELWDNSIRHAWDSIRHYTVDLLLTRDLSRGHIIDFNPFAPRTDPLLFTYEELLHIHLSHPSTPTFKVIDSRAHPAANLNSPAHQHNMIPFDTLTLSSGRDIDEFAAAWKDQLEKGMSGRPGDSDSE